MAKENDVHLVESISDITYPCGKKIGGTPPTSNV
jgi:hypothetical protein